jgi:hypothetical protein
MAQTISVRINLNQIEKAKLYTGAKGTYLDAVIFLKDEVDQYGNSGMVVQSVTAEQRAAGEKGNILGNVKVLGAKQPSTNSPISSQTKAETYGDLPF